MPKDLQARSAQSEPRANIIHMPTAEIRTPADLERQLARPTDADIACLRRLDGDILILGAGGKMGPSLARLCREAADAAGKPRRVIAVSRGVQPEPGIDAIPCDLLDRAQVAQLPEAPNVLYLAGRKFGSSGSPELTWAMNTVVPAVVADRFRNSRIVAFSTGNIYPFRDPAHGGSVESDLPMPVGEYAQSCLGRERMFEYFSARHGTPGRIVRLNYAIDMRYGVLFDVASKVQRGEPVDVTMGYVNVIWQGDANAQVLRCLAHCTVPTTPINVTGPETVSVRGLAHQLAARLGTTAQVVGQEAATALLSDTARAAALFGYPLVPLGRMLDWVADWVKAGGVSLGKPTKFEVRDGSF
jgi:nucleoside-diphosphate-sugar epimerase